MESLELLRRGGLGRTEGLGEEPIRGGVGRSEDLEWKEFLGLRRIEGLELEECGGLGRTDFGGLV